MHRNRHFGGGYGNGMTSTVGTGGQVFVVGSGVEAGGGAIHRDPREIIAVIGFDGYRIGHPSSDLNGTCGIAIHGNGGTFGLSERDSGKFIRLVNDFEGKTLVYIGECVSISILRASDTAVIGHGMLMARHILHGQRHAAALLQILGTSGIAAVQGHAAIARRSSGYTDVDGIPHLDIHNILYPVDLVSTPREDIDIVSAVPNGLIFAVGP